MQLDSERLLHHRVVVLRPTIVWWGRRRAPLVVQLPPRLADPAAMLRHDWTLLWFVWPLTQVNASNVGDLAVDWYLDLAVPPVAGGRRRRS